MDTLPPTLRTKLIENAAGSIELAELLVDGAGPPPESACRLLRRALATLAELPAPDRAEPHLRLLEGEALRALGEWQAALAPLEAAASGAPDRIEAWLGLGWCLKRLGRLADAITALEKGRAVSPRQPILMYNLAALDSRYRDLTGSERDFDPIRGDPRFVAATVVMV